MKDLGNELVKKSGAGKSPELAHLGWLHSTTMFICTYFYNFLFELLLF